MRFTLIDCRLDGFHRGRQHFFFIICERNLKNLFHSTGTDQTRDSDEKAVDAVFAFAECGTGKYALFIFEVRLGNDNGAPGGTEESIAQLKAGDRVYITGYLYTGRDSAHKRLVDLIEQGKDLPIEIDGQVIYYVGPTPPKPGQVIGSAGPTTSGRMESTHRS